MTHTRVPGRSAPAPAPKSPESRASHMLLATSSNAFRTLVYAVKQHDMT